LFRTSTLASSALAMPGAVASGFMAGGLHYGDDPPPGAPAGVMDTRRGRAERFNLRAMITDREPARKGLRAGVHPVSVDNFGNNILGSPGSRVA